MSRSSSRPYRSRSALRLACQLLASGRPKGSCSSGLSGSRACRTCCGFPVVRRDSHCWSCERLTSEVKERGLGPPASWPRTRSARANSTRVPRALLPGSLGESSGTCGFLRQREDAAEQDQHTHAKPGNIQQETATLDKDRHDRVTLASWTQQRAKQRKDRETALSFP
jgi:hypothetical protein